MERDTILIIGLYALLTIHFLSTLIYSARTEAKVDRIEKTLDEYLEILRRV